MARLIATLLLLGTMRPNASITDISTTVRAPKAPVLASRSDPVVGIVASG
jgi:hypothetical protein